MTLELIANEELDKTDNAARVVVLVVAPWSVVAYKLNLAGRNIIPPTLGFARTTKERSNERRRFFMAVE